MLLLMAIIIIIHIWPIQYLRKNRKKMKAIEENDWCN